MHQRGSRTIRLLGAAIAAVAGLLAVPARVATQVPACGPSPNVPLTDLTRSYRGLDIGLYPGRRTTVPPEHLAIGLEQAARIRPLDVRGDPSPTGRVILLSVGMSNTSMEFGRFVKDAARNPAVSRRLTILNGALSGMDAAAWTDRNGPAWQFALRTVGRGDLSPTQVQVVWLKQTHIRTTPFPQEVDALAADIQQILRIAKAVFPNLRMVLLSSRTRAGVPGGQGPAEPQAYETAFAVRRVIEAQMANAGPVGARDVWLRWGPYLWANEAPRSDGFAWTCDDLVPRDLIHPSESGSAKVSDELMAFFMTDATTAPWFLEPSQGTGGPSIARVAASASAGAAPLSVTFDAAVTGASRYFWSFDDGTSSLAPAPRKTFAVNGRYTVQLTVTDAQGRWARSTATIQVGPGG